MEQWIKKSLKDALDRKGGSCKKNRKRGKIKTLFLLNEDFVYYHKIFILISSKPLLQYRRYLHL